MLPFELGEHMPTYAMNLRGKLQGGNKVTVDEVSAYELAKYMADFDNVIDKMGVERVNLFGYSHNGYFTTAYALVRPERVSALILIEPALFTDPDNLRHRAELALSSEGVEAIETMLDYVSPGMESETKSGLAQSIKDNYQSNKAIAGEFLVRANNPISEEDLASLRMPVLLIGGTESHAKSMVVRAAAAIPHAFVWWVKGANHLELGSDKYAAEVTKVVTLFTRQVEAARNSGNTLAGEE